MTTRAEFPFRSGKLRTAERGARILVELAGKAVAIIAELRSPIWLADLEEFQNPENPGIRRRMRRVEC